MKRLTVVMVIMFAFLIVSIAVWADYKPRVLGDEDIAVSGTTVYTLTPSSTSVVSAFINVQGGPIRWKGYTTDPTTTNGSLMNDGDYLLLDSRYQVDNFGAILDSTGSGATIYIIYYGPND